MPPMASVVTSQTMAPTSPVPEKAVSAMDTPDSAVLPVFETAKEYASSWPAAEMVCGETVFVIEMLGVSGVIPTTWVKASPSTPTPALLKPMVMLSTVGVGVLMA